MGKRGWQMVAVARALSGLALLAPAAGVSMAATPPAVSPAKDAKTDVAKEAVAKDNAKTEAKTESKIEAKTESKIESKIESKKDGKGDAKKESPKESHKEAKQDPKSEPTKDSPKDAKTEGKAGAKVDAKADPKADTKKDAKKDPKKTESGVAAGGAKPGAGGKAGAAAAKPGEGGAAAADNDEPTGPITPPIKLSALRDEMSRPAPRHDEHAATRAEREKLEQLAAEINKAREGLRQDTARLEAMLAARDATPSPVASSGTPASGDGGDPPKKVPSPLDSLAKAIRGMKAEQAAPIISRVDRKLAADVLLRMPGADAGKVMGVCKPEVAAELAAEIASRAPHAELRR